MKPIFIVRILAAALGLLLAVAFSGGPVSAEISEDFDLPRVPPEFPVLHSSSAPGYCESHGGSHAYEYILDAYYTRLTEDTLSITVEIFIENPNNCQAGDPCPEYDTSPEFINGWIDWNGDQAFDSSERVLDVDLTGYLGINYYGTMSTSTIVSIPADAVDSTWMRVNLGWSGDAVDPCENPCENNWTWGDIVDRVVAPRMEVPVISQINVTGIPDANNPMTSDTSVAGAEKVRLEAVINEVAGYTVTNVSWSGDVLAGNGNPYEYTPAAGTHGMKYVMCSITYEDDSTLESWTDTRGRNFKLFFKKDGNDDGDSEPNWFEYWNSDGAVPDMNVAAYNAALGAYGQWTGSQVELGPSAANQHYSSAIVLNTHFGTESFGGPAVKGVDCAAEVIAHELYHAWVDDQWDSGGAWHGQDDSDEGVPCTNCDDDLPDNYETNTSHTDPDDETDTYDLEHKKQSQYARYGDQEYMAMRTADGARGIVIRDWANPGKQSNPAYGCHSLGDYAPVHAELIGNYSDMGVDVDGDSFYDHLRVRAEINVTAGGVFHVFARLQDPALNEITWLNQEFILNPGLQAIKLDFDGLAIREYGANGPYIVDIELMDQEGMDVDQQQGTYTTAAYSYNDFEQRDASFSGAYSETVSDTGGGSGFDILRIVVGVEVTTAKDYLIEGGLYDSEGKAIEIASAAVSLSAGSQTVALDFNGPAIFRNRLNGPYYLKYLSLSGSPQVDFIKDAYTTGAYSYSDFEKADAVLSGSYSDHGSDTDSDGQYNSLTVDVQLDVTAADSYTLTGWLYSSDGQIIMASGSAALAVGMQSLPLNFEGTSIYLHGVDGPYFLKYVTLHNQAGELMDTLNDAYTTVSYSYTEFERPLVATTGVYSDYGTDLDSDGKYDILTVAMQLSLAQQGYCVVRARLMDANGKEIAWAENIAQMEADSPEMIELVFDGADIYANGVDGPYYLSDAYMYHTGDPFQPAYIREAYTTSAYGYCEFGNCPPKAIAGTSMSFECTGPGGAMVTLDGSQSYDPDGDALTYTWTNSFGTLNGATQSVMMGLGIHDITLTVDDGNGGSDSSTIQITVQDTIGPALELTLTPDQLWPPNHKLASVAAALTVSDTCDAGPTVDLVSIASNEPDDGLGDGDFPNDIQGADFGTDDREFLLRAERAANGSGRVYTVTYTAQDASGNTRSATAGVLVPHDKK